MVAEVDFESIPATQSLAVFQGCYLSLQKFHSCFIWSFTVFDEIPDSVTTVKDPDNYMETRLYFPS